MTASEPKVDVAPEWRPATTEELQAFAEALDKEQKSRAARWTVIVGVGNGAALAAVGTVVFDILGGEWTPMRAELVAALVVSMVSFTGGVFCAGLSVALDALRFRKGLALLHRHIAGLPGGRVSVNRRIPSWPSIILEYGFEAFGSLLFVQGLLFPLIWFQIIFAAAGFKW